jgi:hypothetical protein
MTKPDTTCISLKPLKRQIHFWVTQQIYEKWEKFRQERGYSEMSSFIISCVNDKIYPMPMSVGNVDITTQIGELKRIHENLESEIVQLINRPPMMIQQSPNIEDSELVEKILESLQKSGPTTEYYLANEMNIQSSHAYMICAKLFRENKIQQDQKGNWYVED